MYVKKAHRTIGLVLSTAIFVSVAGCGGDSAVAGDEAVEPPEEIQGPDEIAFTLAECGALPDAQLPVSTNLTAPTAAAQGQIFGGRIGPRSATSDSHAWSVDLPKGKYRVVIDSSTIAGNSTNIGLTVDLTVNNGPSKNIIAGSQIDSRNRESISLSLDQDSLLVLNVSPKFKAEAYVMGVFAEDTPIPSPYFLNCPTIKEMVLDSAVNFDLGPLEPFGAADVWYRIKLDQQRYRLTHIASQAQSSNIRYRVLTHEIFGQSSATEEINRVSEIGLSTTQSADFTYSGSLPVWIRFVPTNREYSMNATVSQAPELEED